MTANELRGIHKIVSKIVWLRVFEMSWTWVYEGNILSITWDNGQAQGVNKFFIGTIDFDRIIKPMLS